MERLTEGQANLLRRINYPLSLKKGEYPTYSEVRVWFMKEHGLFIKIEPYLPGDIDTSIDVTSQCKYCVSLLNITMDKFGVIKGTEMDNFTNYNDAFIVGFYAAVEYVLPTYKGNDKIDLFKDAEFGDKYRTRDGKVFLFHHVEDDDCVWLIGKEWGFKGDSSEVEVMVVSSDGKWSLVEGENSPNDIIEKVE